MKEKLARQADLLRYSFRASKCLRQPLLATLRRALMLYRQKRFLAEEAFAVGLLRLDCDPELLRGAVSRRYQAQVQRKVNPVSWSPLLADKGIFYRFCAAHGIPIPDLYAIYFRRTPGYRGIVPGGHPCTTRNSGPGSSPRVFRLSSSPRPVGATEVPGSWATRESPRTDFTEVMA